MKHKAFTLIETVLAVAISAIVMFAGAQLMYNLVKTSEFFETNWSLRAHADGVERYLRSSFMNSNITKASKLPEVLFSRNKNNLCIAKLFEEENSNRYYLVFSEKKAHPMYLPATGVAVEKICFLDFIEGEGLSVIWTTNESDDRKRQAEPIIYKTFLTPYVKQLSYIYPDTVWREEPKLDTAINAMPEYVKLVFERHGETITRIISLKPVIDFQISR